MFAAGGRESAMTEAAPVALVPVPEVMPFHERMRALRVVEAREFGDHGAVTVTCPGAFATVTDAHDVWQAMEIWGSAG